MKPNIEVRSIGRPPADVYDYIVDMQNFPSWVPGLSNFTQPENPVAVGDVMRFKVKGLGLKLTFVTLDPARKIAYDIEFLFGGTHVSIELEQDESGQTRLTKQNTGNYNWLGRLMGPIVRRIDSRQVREEVDLIKQNLER